jgi:hypothetical protein
MPRSQAKPTSWPGEELEHAALLRRWRRAAYHKDTAAAQKCAPPNHDDRGTRMPMLSEREAAIAGCYRELAGKAGGPRRPGERRAARVAARRADPAALDSPSPAATRTATTAIRFDCSPRLKSRSKA